VQEFILGSAPHQMIDGLISLWEDEFLPEMIEVIILENQDDAPEIVVRILSEHCHIRAAAEKKSPAKKTAPKKTPAKSTSKTASTKKAPPKKPQRKT
jgi:hypothetical protein